MTPVEVLDQLAATRPQQVAFIKDQEIWTYERLAAEVERFAQGLVERGLRKGDRVALQMANLPESVVAYHACFRVIAAPSNIRFKTAELKPLLQRLRPSLYIGQAALYSNIASIDSSILAANRRFVVDVRLTIHGCSPGKAYLPMSAANRFEGLRMWTLLPCSSPPPEPPVSRNLSLDSFTLIMGGYGNAWLAHLRFGVRTREQDCEKRAGPLGRRQ